MPLSPTFERKVGELFSKFGKFKRTVQLKMKDIPLEDLKDCITSSYSDLTIQVNACETSIDVLKVVEQKCSLTNISKMECIADEFECKEALKDMEEFKECVKAFCNEVRLNVTYGVALTDSEIKQLLKCEKIEFILQWQPEEHILKEIKNLLWATFEDMYKNIVIISQDRGN